MTKQEEIKQLKTEQDAVILAHYYVNPQVQELADYIGDSFYLSKMAAGLENRTLVFCGVSFMGESRKAPESQQGGPDARRPGRLPHGPHGNQEGSGAIQKGISRPCSGLLHQFHSRNQVLVRCVRHICQCGTDCKEPAKPGHPFHTG